MKIKFVAVVFLFATMLHLQAEPVVIASPDKVQVKVFSAMSNMGLHCKNDKHLLVASITFSNVNYVSPGESLGDQTVIFALPGVKYEPSDKTFYKEADSARIPVATMKEGAFGRSISLAPGAKILALDNDGTISVMLVATKDRVFGSQWVRVQEDPTLQRMFASAESSTGR